MWTAWGGKKVYWACLQFFKTKLFVLSPSLPQCWVAGQQGGRGTPILRLQPSPGSGGSNELGQWAGFISSVLEQGELPCKLLAVSAHISCLNIKTFPP